ncbi:MAG: hypothetical protein ABFD04_10850 [Syntrophomonas sp.]
MLGEFTNEEVELLNAFTALKPGGQREIKEYMSYVLGKQYKREVKVSVFNNKLLHNLFHSLLHIVEKEDFDLILVGKRVAQIKELYYAIFEQVHNRYAEMVPELDSNEVVREFARIGFENLNSALAKGKQEMIRLEIVDFYQEYNKLAQRRDARQIVAV